jgi:hypothetical protein
VVHVAPADTASGRSGRRHLLQRAAWAVSLGLAGASAARAQPETAHLLVPGPEEGVLFRWAQRLAAAFARGLVPAAPRIGIEAVGGPDGVTAANRFATMASPDGRTLLLLPGTACHARLIGDPRARFDPAPWLPVCATQVPWTMLARVALPLGVSPPPALRLALVGPDHPTTAALLGLDLLGIPAQPVFGLSPSQAEAAVAQDSIEALLVQDGAAAARLEALGGRPWFALGTEGRAPSLAGALDRGAPPALRGALEAGCAAAQVLAMVVLPALTPADRVAQWRAAAQRWHEEETRLAASPPRASGATVGRTVAGPEAAVLLQALAGSAEAQRAYQDWLIQRLRWRAG